MGYSSAKSSSACNPAVGPPRHASLPLLSLPMMVCLTALFGPANPSHAADLAIQRLSLHQYDDGPILGSGYEYLPGETVWFTGRITGYTREKRAREDGKGDDEHVRLAWTARILDPSGILLEESQTGLIDTRLVAEDKEWVAKFGIHFTIPSFVPRGVYRIAIAIQDEVAKREVSGATTFRVRGDDLPATQALGMANFRFLAREDDRAALQPVRYRQGDQVIVRFDIVGHGFGEKNRYSVEYGIEIFGPPKVEEAEAATDSPVVSQPERPLYSQPLAATESQESFYPQRRVPAGFRIPLESNAPLGTHTLVLTLRDKISGKSEAFRLPFEVR